MKRLLGASFMVLAAALVLVGCCESNQGNKKMKRITTPSGLQYEDTQEGTGVSPRPGQVVTVHYTGVLDNNGARGAKF
ncbi:MAG TPA: FKBP-type peptidyl-prolyl cis-trans isomerase, partial [Candidatus Limnocylindria bacterium]|nr:FKBP-type peptidyl-prolyl cis-trans isomerase [Candidatus Limnocylindria bacterium]